MRREQIRGQVAPEFARLPGQRHATPISVLSKRRGVRGQVVRADASM